MAFKSVCSHWLFLLQSISFINKSRVLVKLCTMDGLNGERLRTTASNKPTFAVSEEEGQVQSAITSGDPPKCTASMAWVPYMVAGSIHMATITPPKMLPNGCP